MDSGNSGSMQSSSGGYEEYDSRAEAISSFLNNNNNSNPLSHIGPMPNNLPPQPGLLHHHQPPHPSSSSSTVFFDPLSSNYFDPALSSSRSPPPPLLNLDMIWSKNLRSDPNCTDLGGIISGSSPSQQLLTNQTQTRDTFPSLPSHVQESAPGGPAGSVSAGTHNINDQASNNNSSTAVRNPKKRSRASRRAPTTVLTTDTTNFRAMVQEFTGIPAPPFTSSPFPRSRLDLFGTAASTLRSAVSHHLDAAPPPYLLRTFAQKINPPAPPSFVSSGSTASSFSSSMVDAVSSTTSININKSGACTDSTTTNSNISSTSISYQLPPQLSLLKHPHNLLDINVESPNLNFHPPLKAPPKYPFPNSCSILGTTTKPQVSSLEISSNDSRLKVGVLEELGLSHGHNITRFQNIVSSSSAPSVDTTLMRTDHNNNLANWGDGVGSDEGDHQQRQQQHDHLMSSNGNYDSSTQGVTGEKVNFMASSASNFHVDKVAENVTTRAEGMMESWICSSD